MFDGKELATAGMLTTIVKHPKTGKRSRMEFYVATKHSRAILGIKACKEMDLVSINVENLCTLSTVSSKSLQPAALTKQDIMNRFPSLFKGVRKLKGKSTLKLINQYHQYKYLPGVYRQQLKNKLSRNWIYWNVMALLRRLPSQLPGRRPYCQL